MIDRAVKVLVLDMQTLVDAVERALLSGDGRDEVLVPGFNERR